MAVAAYYVLSALGLIVAVQATCSLRTNQEAYSGRDQKIAVGLSTHGSVGSKWQVLNAKNDEVAISGSVKEEAPVALIGSIRSFTADFSSLTAAGSYKVHVDGCTDSPMFTIENPLFERAERSNVIRASGNKTGGYDDPGVSRGVGVTLVVLTVILFVIMVGLLIWVVALYCF